MNGETSISGIRDLDGQFAKMAIVKDACEKAGVAYPEEVFRYFNNHPDETISLLRLEMETINIESAVRRYSTDASDHIEIVLKNLPPDVIRIRVTN